MIYGNRIRLRANERTDLSLFTRWLNDPEVREHISHTLPFSLALEEQWFENMLKRPREEHPLGIEIQSGEDWKLIGNTGLFDFDWHVRSAELGILIGEKTCWDKGYGTETMRLVLKHGFETLNLNRIYLRVHANNGRGIRVYEKVAFVHEGSLRQAVYREGQYQDMLLMSILREEWDATKV
ncbi:MAG: GNAT family protein [Chloroflexota bacterium]